MRSEAVLAALILITVLIVGRIGSGMLAAVHDASKDTQHSVPVSAVRPSENPVSSINSATGSPNVTPSSDAAAVQPSASLLPAISPTTVGVTPTLVLSATPTPTQTAMPTPTQTTTPAPTVTLLLSSTPAATASSSPSPTPYAIVVGTRRINVRAEPGSKSAVVGGADPGERLPVSHKDATGKWVRLSGTAERWVAANLVKIIGDLTQNAPVTQTPTSVPPADSLKSVLIGVVIAPHVNVRSGPGTTFPVVAGVKAGDRLLISGKNATGDWVRLTGPTERWVLAGALDLLPVPTPTP